MPGGMCPARAQKLYEIMRDNCRYLAFEQRMNTAITTTGHGGIPPQAARDRRLLEPWLQGRPATTQRAYRTDADQFLTFTQATLHDVTLGHLQAFADHLLGQQLKPSTRVASLAPPCPRNPRT